METVGDKDVYGRKGRGGCVGMFSRLRQQMLKSSVLGTSSPYR